MMIATEVSSATTGQPYALLESQDAPTEAGFLHMRVLRFPPPHGFETLDSAAVQPLEFAKAVTPQQALFRAAESTTELPMLGPPRLGLLGFPFAGLVEVPVHPTLILARPVSQWLPLEGSRGASSRAAVSAAISREAMSLFEGIDLDDLEDGMTAGLGQSIHTFVERFGSEAIDAIAGILSSEHLSPELVSHTLRWLGRNEHPGSFRARLWLLRRCLRSRSPMVRDGAALGLAALGSPLALPSLEAALGRETHRGLRRDLERVVEHLKREG